MSQETHAASYPFDSNETSSLNDTTADVRAKEEDVTSALRRVGVFADLPEDQLQWFIAHAEEKHFAAGEIVFRKGEPADRMIVYLAGEMHSRPDDKSLDGYVFIASANDPATQVSGRLPFSRMKEWAGTGYTVTPTRALLFPSNLFSELLSHMPELGERLVGLMSDRVREFTTANQQRDKLIALGKLSAGLAHELNNPAAAAARAADELLNTLENLRHADLSLCKHQLSREQRELIAEFERTAISHQNAESSPAAFDALAQSDREDELLHWLESHNVKDGWELTQTLVEAGVDAAQLEEFAKEIGGEALGDVLARVSAQLSTAHLVSDIRTSASRISELVGAIKEYSYMDQAPVQEVDLHKGLENTLLILKHKLKVKGAQVVREYDAEVPHITATGSSLNQVWTNLIDNAIDALPAQGGRLKVRTKREPTDVLIEIRDNGAGIPPEVQTRIFEPFYTTKPLGEGTGLGLDTVQRVVRQHHGHIRFESEPGDTCFQIRLPLSVGSHSR